MSTTDRQREISEEEDSAFLLKSQLEALRESQAMEIEEITEINVTILQATNFVSLDAPAMAAVALREALGALRPHIALQESEQAEFEKKRIAERSGVEQ